MTIEELTTATDDERLHWLGAACKAAGADEAFDLVADTFERVVLVNRALPKALADLASVEGDARVPAAVKAAVATIRTDLGEARTTARRR